MAWEYTKKIKELFQNAVNRKPSSYYGVIEDADAIGEHGSIACGDAIKFYLKIEQDPETPFKDKIVKASYETFGCTSAIASSEALCHIVETRGLTPFEALNVSSQEIIDFLGGMPEQKIHCSVMGAEVLKATVANWVKKRKIDFSIYGIDPSSLNLDLEDDHGHEEKIICKCNNIDEEKILHAIRDNDVENIDHLVELTHAGNACGSCISMPGGLHDLLAEHGTNNISEKIIEAIVLSDEEVSKINAIFSSGTIKEKLNIEAELIEIKDNKVYCSFDSEDNTEKLKNDVESYLREFVSTNLVVIDF